MNLPNNGFFLERLSSLKTRHESLNLKAEFMTFVEGEFKKMKELPNSEKKSAGEGINKIKISFEEAFSIHLKNIRKNEIEEALSKEKIDITLPSFENKFGGVHPVTFVQNELIMIMEKYGFNLVSGPEIETNYYNFDALNIEETHPAREMHDTFYLDFLDEKKSNFLLRTHTSTAQIRGMENSKPPFAFISTGRTYRSDFDKTHTPMFNQIECLFVDKGVNMGNLLWLLDKVFSEFFEGKSVEIRLRPSFFPFTEPSAEVDINIGGGFLEVMGAGMVHPKVLQNCGINPEEYSGFAFGAGIERLAMLKYGINDLRDFFNSNQKWSEVYGFRV